MSETENVGPLEGAGGAVEDDSWVFPIREDDLHPWGAVGLADRDSRASTLGVRELLNTAAEVVDPHPGRVAHDRLDPPVVVDVGQRHVPHYRGLDDEVCLDFEGRAVVCHEMPGYSEHDLESGVLVNLCQQQAIDRSLKGEARPGVRVVLSVPIEDVPERVRAKPTRPGTGDHLRIAVGVEVCDNHAGVPDAGAEYRAVPFERNCHGERVHCFRFERRQRELRFRLRPGDTRRRIRVGKPSGGVVEHHPPPGVQVASL